MFDFPWIYSNPVEAGKIQAECAFYEYKCDDGKCIDHNKLLDGVNDCDYGEDESENVNGRIIKHTPNGI